MATLQEFEAILSALSKEELGELREAMRNNKPSSVYVAMESELVQFLTLLAAKRYVSRSALCRQLILLGLPALTGQHVPELIELLKDAPITVS